jgi:hypothetical protein
MSEREARLARDRPALGRPPAARVAPGTPAPDGRRTGLPRPDRPTPDGPAPEQTPSPRGVTRQDIFSVLGALGAVITLVTAVMFYFGWRRSDVQAQAMGIDVSLFGYSSQDYVLQSISSFYLTLLVLAGIGLGCVWLHGRVVDLLHSQWLATSGRRSAAAAWTGWIALAGFLLTAVCVLFAVAAGLQSTPPPVAALRRALVHRQWAVPLVLVLATVAASYVWWIHRQLAPVPAAPDPPPWWRTLLPAVLTAVIVLLGAFWMLEEYASAVGRGYAQQVAADVNQLPRTVVLSRTPLGIQAPGVREERIGAPGSPEVRYRTTGLRLLARSGGKVLLVHDGWSPRTGTVIVLSDDDQLGWEFSR